MAEKLDVHNIKEVLAFGMGMHMAYDKSMANDGKLAGDDIQFLIDPMMKAMPAIKDIDQVIPEFKDMDEAERDELISWMKTTYDIADDKLENTIEKALAWAVSTGELIASF